MFGHSKLQSGMGVPETKCSKRMNIHTYKLQGKFKEPTLCPACEVVFPKRAVDMRSKTGRRT
jgi:hypothetical protein